MTGAFEFLGDIPYFTITTGTARKVFTLSDTTLVSGRIPVVTTNGRLTDFADFTFATSPGLVLNDSGSATIGLRVEGDTDANLFVTAPSTDFVGVGVAIPDRKFHVEDNSAVTNAIRYVSRFTHGSSGTVATNFGIGHEFEMENASNALKIIGTQSYQYTDATNNSEDVTWRLALIKAGALTDALTVTSLGDLTVAGTLNATNVYSSLYTPTLTNTTNLDASTARQATFFRVGNSVTVSGQIDIDPTAPGAVLLGMSLPVASALTTVYQVGGTAAATAITGQSAGIEADATNDRASMKFIAVDITNQTMTYTFTYQVI